MGFDATLFLGIEIREFTMQIFSKTDLLVDFQSSITESFSYVKYGLSIIMSKILSKILSNENKKIWCFQKNSSFWHINSVTRPTGVNVFITEIF